MLRLVTPIFRCLKSISIKTRDATSPFHFFSHSPRFRLQRQSRLQLLLFFLPPSQSTGILSINSNYLRIARGQLVGQATSDRMQLFFFSALLAAVSANVSSSSSSSSSSAILPSPSKASSATSFLDALHTVPLVSEDRSLRLLAMLAADSKVTKSVEGLDGFKSSHSFRIQERAAKNVLSQLQHRQVEEEGEYDESVTID